MDISSYGLSVTALVIDQSEQFDLDLRYMIIQGGQAPKFLFSITACVLLL